MFADLVEPASAPTVYLVTGHAGTGKTTLLRTAAFDIASEFKVPVLIHIPGTPLDVRVLGAVVDEKEPKRIIVIVQHAADYVREIERFIEENRRLKLPVSLVLEERKNQWGVAAATATKRLAPVEIELGSVSDTEIRAILEALEKWKCFGKLTGSTFEYQRDHFVSLADKELLVALRELTSPDSSFDAIVRNEYHGIPSAIAQRAYVYVSALGQVGLYLRYEHLIRNPDLRYDQLGSDVFKPTDGILISGGILR